MGLSSAALGLFVLMFPGLSAPDPLGALLMTFAGAAWGGYTLVGRGSQAPVADTARNFLFATPLALVLSALAFRSATLTRSGVVLAVISGAVTSGVGYALWYAALGALSAVQASVLQLCVPVLATAAGIVFLGEVLSGRVVLASCMILGGVALVINGREAPTPSCTGLPESSTAAEPSGAPANGCCSEQRAGAPVGTDLQGR